MFIDNLAEVKEMIQHNIELFRLHNVMNANQNHPEIVNVARNANFIHRRALWFSQINSLYSSIVMIREYMKKQNHPLDDLDTGFTLTGWHIHSCRQYDVIGVNDATNVSLGTVLRRMRNSVGHGKFEIQRPTDDVATNCLIVFHDEDQIPRNANTPDRFFELKLKVLDVSKFLEKLEACFRTKYP